MPSPQNVVTPSPEICVRCKGRLWCGPKCFIIERYEKKQQTVERLKSKDLMSSSPPGVFVSWNGYPKVKLSPMAPAVEQQDVWLTDDSDKWFGLPAEKIISFRESLVRGNMDVEVKQAADPSYSLLDVQETLMAKKPVGIEMELKSAPKLREQIGRASCRERV